MRLTTLTVKMYDVMNCFKAHWTYTDSLAKPKQWKKDMRFGTWNDRSLFRVCAIKPAVG
jgi:hypothetical protein